MANYLSTRKQIDVIVNKVEGFTKFYDPSFPEELIRHGSCGNDPSTFAGDLNVPPFLIDEWRATYPEFNDAYKICWLKVVLFWESALTNAAHNRNKTMADAAKFRLVQVYHKVDLLEKDPLYNTAKKTRVAVGDSDLANDLQEQIKKETK